MKYICIHGHFYQPPRENPWLEFVELQDSAYPYHDWNERITAECYAPNSVARILDSEGRIVKLVNNYARMSFNFGPTLLNWMDEQAPDVYRAILAADEESRERFSGHGSAMAQAYNHMILPLANSRDKYTQVFWGYRDFQSRFGRRPEGMWLPETAVDLESLEAMARLGVKFTVLAPHQAAKVRKIGSATWQEVLGGRIDPTQPYQLTLPSGRTINLFFYHQGLSHAVAFEGLLRNGEHFARRLLEGFSPGADRPQLVHISADGETYGHHQPHGDMALAYALHVIESNGLARLTNYGEYLEQHPPTHEVQIIENTSWSCAHGVERWRSNCGCNSGGHPMWTQGWRAPLREAFDWLRDTLARHYEDAAGELLRDPWAARDDYIDVILERTPAALEAFLGKHAARSLSPAERVRVLKLLELQRHAMLMYTSCGWFFDELSGIETVQVIQYAGRAVQLAGELFGDNLEGAFLQRLRQAKSNIPEHEDGARIYEKFVRPARVDLVKVGAHYALSSLFAPYGQRTRIYSFTVERQDYRSGEQGRTRFAVGRARVTSEITGESATLSFGVLHLGDHNLTGGVRPYEAPEAYETMAREIQEAFARADLPAVMRLIDGHFGPPTYSLRSLFRDEQRRILNVVLKSTLSEVEEVYRRIYETYGPMMNVLRDLRIPQPEAFLTAAEFVINTSLAHELEHNELDLASIRKLLEDARRWEVELDAEGLSYGFREVLERSMERLRDCPHDLELIERVDAVAGLIRSLPFEVNLWRSQNLFWELLQTRYPSRRQEGEKGDTRARAWAERFRALGEKLAVRVG